MGYDRVVCMKRIGYMFLLELASPRMRVYLTSSAYWMKKLYEDLLKIILVLLLLFATTDSELNCDNFAQEIQISCFHFFIDLELKFTLFFIYFLYAEQVS